METRRGLLWGLAVAQKWRLRKLLVVRFFFFLWSVFISTRRNVKYNNTQHTIHCIYVLEMHCFRFPSSFVTKLKWNSYLPGSHSIYSSHHLADSNQAPDKLLKGATEATDCTQNTADKGITLREPISDVFRVGMGYKAPPLACFISVLSIKTGFLFHDLYPEFYPSDVF